MRKDFVPEVVEKGQVDICQKSKEVCLEGTDGAFGCVASVNIRRNELVVTFLFLRYYTPILLDILVVDYLGVYLVETLLEAENDSLLGRDMMEVLIRLEGLD